MHPYAENIAKIGAKANPTFMTLGIEPVSWGNESAVLKMNADARIHNGSGFLQGGFYVILADEAIALAILAELTENEGTTTITETTEFIRGLGDNHYHRDHGIHPRHKRRRDVRLGKDYPERTPGYLCGSRSPRGKC